MPLSCSLYADFDFDLYRLLEMEIGTMAGVTCRQGMFPPRRPLFPPLIYQVVHVCPILNSKGCMRLMTFVHYSCFLPNVQIFCLTIASILALT
jgi:hypothetical protein